MADKSGMTGEARVLDVLRSVESIESWDLAQRSGLMDNTCVKYVKYLRDKGHTILSERVEGKAWCRYTYVSSPKQVELPKKQKPVESVPYFEDPQATVQRWLNIASGYPHEHPQLACIMRQIDEFERKNKRVA